MKTAFIDIERMLAELKREPCRVGVIIAGGPRRADQGRYTSALLCKIKILNCPQIAAYAGDLP